jgi:adenosylcobinamide-GDP ribazoletransferase
VIVLQALFCAVAFLTRIPVPGTGALPPRVAGVSVAFFPAVGLLLGAASCGLAWLLFDRLGLPPHPVWALALVALQALLTGALHLDGLSDVVDGLGGSRGDRERALEIMKDPRVGAFGVVALIVVLGAKLLVMNEVLRLPERASLLLAYPALARFVAALLVVFLPCARSTGLAHSFHQEARWPAALFGALVVAGVLWAQGGSTALPAAWALGIGMLVGLGIAARLRGLTGDGYGAAIELAELTFLFVAAFPRLRGA